MRKDTTFLPKEIEIDASKSWYRAMNEPCPLKELKAPKIVQNSFKRDFIVKNIRKLADR
jgi:hypothetical protein